jgi:hypothetical protein
VADYATAVGFVQFEVTERDLPSGQTVRDATIRTPGSDGRLVRITLWPEFDETEVNEGDFIAVDGKFEERQVEGKTYLNLNPNKLAVLAAAPRAEREVERKSTKSKKNF